MGAIAATHVLAYILCLPLAAETIAYVYSTGRIASMVYG